MKKGDKALCINIANTCSKYRSPSLKLKHEYYVHNVKVCICGNVSLDVGLKKHNDLSGIACQKCRVIVCGDTWWCSSNRFIKQEEKSDSMFISKEEIIDSVKNNITKYTERVINKEETKT